MSLPILIPTSLASKANGGTQIFCFFQGIPPTSKHRHDNTLSVFPMDGSTQLALLS